MTIVIHLLLDALLIYLGIGVLYIAVFALAAVSGRKRQFEHAEPSLRFRVLYPAYREDAVICRSVTTALQQTYPRHLFTVCVIADHMQADTLQSLLDLGAEVLELHTEESSKAKALTLAMQHEMPLNGSLKQGGGPYDYVVILDADNEVTPDYLQQVNDYLTATGERVLQTHRKAKNLNTPTAVLDAAIEEINNSLFRTGHVNLGISSSLIGSGMVIDHRWFADHIALANTAGEDKELEEMILREGIHIGYAPHIPVYDEKVQQPNAMRQQRRRWIATQVMLARLMWRHAGKALLQGHTDYVLKAIETLIPPRSLFLLLLALVTVISLPLSLPHAAVGLGLWLITLISMYVAIPRELRSRRLAVAIRRVPSFMGLMISNLFHLRGASGQFIHTAHGEESKDIK